MIPLKTKVGQIDVAFSLGAPDLKREAEMKNSPSVFFSVSCLQCHDGVSLFFTLPLVTLERGHLLPPVKCASSLTFGSGSECLAQAAL